MPVIGEAAINLVANTRPLASSLGQIGGMMRTYLAPVAKIGGIIGSALSAATVAAGAFGTKLAADMEQTEIAFESMLGSVDKAKRVIGDLKQFSDVTPFEPDEVIAAGRALIAFKEPTDQLTQTLTRLGDISAGLRIPLGDLTDIYGKARVNGRLMMDDINQLTGRGIPIISELAKQFGVTEGEVRDLVSSGEVGFKNLERAFADLTSEGGMFFNLMAKQSQSAIGLWSTFQGAMKDIFRDFGKILMEELNLKSTLSAAIEQLRGFREIFIPTLRSAVQILREFSKTVAGAAGWIYDFMFGGEGLRGVVNKVRLAIVVLAGAFTGLTAAIVAAQAASLMFAKKSLPDLIIATKQIATSLKAFAASLWTVNTAVIALKVAVGAGLTLVILGLAAAFFKARAEGKGLDEVLISLADDAGLVYDKVKHLQIAQERSAKSAKMLADAMKGVESADSLDKQLEANQDLAAALEERIKALKQYSILSRDQAGEMGAGQWRLEARQIEELSERLDGVKKKVDELKTKMASAPAGIDKDVERLTKALQKLNTEVQQYGMSQDDILLADFLAMKKLGKATDEQVQKLIELQNELRRLKGDEYLDDLQRQIDTFGMDDIELKIFDLQNMNLATEQMKQAREMLNELRARNIEQLIGEKQQQVSYFGDPDEMALANLKGATDDQKNRLRELNKELKRLSVGDYIAKLRIDVQESGLSEIERRVNELRREGASEDQIREARQLLEAQRQQDGGGLRIQTVGLTDMFNRIQTAINPNTNDPAKKTADHTKSLVDEAKKTNKALADVVKNTAAAGVAANVAIGFGQ
ncbi:MAG: tape measure protein [Phycisphaeraceae bacterium JB051]